MFNGKQPVHGNTNNNNNNSIVMICKTTLKKLFVCFWFRNSLGTKHYYKLKRVFCLIDLLTKKFIISKFRKSKSLFLISGNLPCFPILFGANTFFCHYTCARRIPGIEHSSLQWQVTHQTTRLRSQYPWILYSFCLVELCVIICTLCDHLWPVKCLWDHKFSRLNSHSVDWIHTYLSLRENWSHGRPWQDWV